MVMGGNVQVCWEKFARYFDVEPRYVPLTTDRYVIGVDEAMALVDENTIGVVGILGSTYTGEYEPIKELNDAMDGPNASSTAGTSPLHVDGASGGFVAPFLQPDLAWDFRLPAVRSINVSGHKYGLVYPGVGWVIWRDEEDLPKRPDLPRQLPGRRPANFNLNFSRGAGQILAQYYNFLRLGHQGYRDSWWRWPRRPSGSPAEIEALGAFKLVGDGNDLPVVCFRLAGEHPFTVFDLSDVLRQRGWIVPAYKMAPDAERCGGAASRGARRAERATWRASWSTTSGPPSITERTCPKPPRRTGRCPSRPDRQLGGADGRATPHRARPPHQQRRGVC